MGLKGGKFDNSNRKCQAETNSDILGLGSRSLFLHIIIYYRPSVVAAFFRIHPQDGRCTRHGNVRRT